MRLSIVLLLFIGIGARAYPSFSPWNSRILNAIVNDKSNNYVVSRPPAVYPFYQPVIRRTAAGYMPPIFNNQMFQPVVRTLYPLDMANQLIRDGKSTAKNDDNTDDQQENELKPQKEEFLSKDTFEDEIRLDDKEDRRFSNYYSFYYDPYFYTLNGYDSHLAPSSYLDLQAQTRVEPLPPFKPEFVPSERLLPALHEEREMMRNFFKQQQKRSNV